MSVGHFHIPGDATKREYAVYIMVATHRTTKERRLYVGKTGDNRDGCNPVISRAGNHFSFNKLHSQMRNHLLPDHPHDYDFDYFYTTFGQYTAPRVTREGIEVVNEMERRLNTLAQDSFGVILNPYKARGRLPKTDRERRTTLATTARLEQLQSLVDRVKSFLGRASNVIQVEELDDSGGGCDEFPSTRRRDETMARSGPQPKPRST